MNFDIGQNSFPADGRGLHTDQKDWWQAIMAERKWTHEEAAQLIELAEAGLTVDEIGDRLDRTGGAVRVKANRIGVDFYVRDIGKFLINAETKRFHMRCARDR
ncbi:hypothetical protein HJA87_31180 [Rhizobium bangladeshense]|uniref:Uncharacterized protein n=1 Tax=Rhizobium bangladeshense TaxID=1138189 RepID=A0ABS7LT22_9HYPH|nr:hypothetical protein [Rhizobium bangladeshense]MBY3594266.1 hypothetical protein [Rhizobium bangladeshense]